MSNLSSHDLERLVDAFVAIDAIGDTGLPPGFELLQAATAAYRAATAAVTATAQQLRKQTNHLDMTNAEAARLGHCYAALCATRQEAQHRRHQRANVFAQGHDNVMAALIAFRAAFHTVD